MGVSMPYLKWPMFRDAFLPPSPARVKGPCAAGDACALRTKTSISCKKCFLIDSFQANWSEAAARKHAWLHGVQCLQEKVASKVPAKHGYQRWYLHVPAFQVSEVLLR